jgi:phosphodiesterase/alkaline phosphatase D-like protein
MDRRTLLKSGAMGVGGLAAAHLMACAPMPEGPPVDLGVWDCGVASGVHAPGAVVLWTRFAPGASASVELTWQVAADPGFASVIASGTAVASPETDGCVKVLVEGLDPGATYWYRFSIGGDTGPVGRTRSLPGDGAALSSVRLAVASCQSWSAGFYPAWRAIAALDIDAVVFLGDYIYESKSGGAGPLNVRVDPEAAVDLPSYRAKYRRYRADPDLRAAHAAHPFAPVWDDHEFVNNCNRLTNLEFPERAAAAYRAWFEYQPVMRIEGDRIHRRARWGRLLDLSLLDTRQYRDPQITGPDDEPIQFGITVDPPLREVHSVGRTLLGDDQRRWFLDGLGAAQQDGVTWKLVGNQVMISPIRLVDLDEPALRALQPNLPEHAGLYVNFDDWSGYMWERDQVTELLRSESVANVGFLTGDIHSFWQSKVLADFDEPFSPAVAQEFVCGSVSSRGFDYVGDLASSISTTLRQTRPGFRYVDLVRRGYGLVDCTPEHASVEFHTVDALTSNPASPTALPRRRARFDWPAGTHDVTLTRP